MSPTPTNHEAQLAEVLQAGFDCGVEDDTLTVGPIPYRLSGGGIGHGSLICHLDRNGGDIAPPTDHTAAWIGDEVPHRRDGRPMDRLIIDQSRNTWSNGETSICVMSRRGPEPYPNYGQKMLTYARLIAREAVVDWRASSPGVVAVKDVNHLVDHETGLNRARVGHLNALLARENIAVIGAGGTGGHIVDLVSKSNVQQIDIYDPDYVSAHTQLRWPGIVERRIVEEETNKAEYLAALYARRTNRNILGHPFAIDKDTLTYLNEKTMVFVAIDKGPARREVLTGLAGMGLNFIDCGIDLQGNDGPLTASLRIIRCQAEQSPEKRSELAVLAPGGANVAEDDPYAQNIQTGEMNSLNAALAVIAWKQGIGFYRDAYGYRRSRMHMATNMWALYDPKHDPMQ